MVFSPDASLIDQLLRGLKYPFVVSGFPGLRGSSRITNLFVATSIFAAVDGGSGVSKIFALVTGAPFTVLVIELSL
ncbi:Uncharacterised protein [uncultured archaeon]|nr:Uncharacterised protein [uncultured archaeon]